MNDKTVKLIQTEKSSSIKFWTWSEKQQQYILLDDKYYIKNVPGYNLFNEKARQKARDKYIKNAVVIKKIWIPDRSSNITQKEYEKNPPDALSFLKICNLFEEEKTGYLLAADFLSGAHTMSIRKIAPEFQPVLTVNSNSLEVAEILVAITKALFRVKREKANSFKIKQKNVLDYSCNSNPFPRHIQDFTVEKVKVKHQKNFEFPIPFSNSSVLIIGADVGQIQEAAPFLTNVAVILLNSAVGSLNPTKLSNSYVAAYDPEIISRVKKNAKNVASMFYWWCNYALNNENAWAQGIVQKARASFGKPDSRYIRVELDPKKFRDAIRYQVLLSFLEELEKAGFMAADELASYRQGAKDVFDPAPPEASVVRHADDPAVFIEIMRELVQNSPDRITPEGKRYSNSDKPLAARRTISGQQFFVFLEDTWSKAYSKAVHSRKDIDHTFFQTKGWERNLQKILSEQGIIKQASSGYRYRYDLLEAGKRDSTYVLAVPADLLVD